MKQLATLLLLASLQVNANTASCPVGASLISPETAQDIYDELKANKSIPYKYVVDGCDVRAYLGAKSIYEKRGLTSFRVNIETYPGMWVDTPYTFESGVEFTKHSALAFCVQSGETQTPTIIDISFFDRPLSALDWSNTLIEDEYTNIEKVNIYTSSMFNLNPEETRERSSFDRQSVRCAHKVAKLFSREEKKIERGQLPYGVGRAKEVLREGLCD